MSIQTTTSRKRHRCFSQLTRSRYSPCKKHRTKYVYEFLEIEEFTALFPKNLATANRVYTQELLFRAHIAALTTLFRNEKWMRGIDASLAQKNYFAFAASLRALVECAADSHYSLIHVPGTLRDHFVYFRSALQGSFTQGVLLCEDLENILIHYSHGRKQARSSTAPDSHFAKTSQEYLRSLDGDSCTHVRNLYAELCEVTHPAERTVSIFVARESETSKEYRIVRDMDMTFISDLVTQHDQAFTNVFQMSFNASLLTLYVLNYFGDSRFYTKGIEHVNMSKVPAFVEIQKTMKSF